MSIDPEAIFLKNLGRYCAVRVDDTAGRPCGVDDNIDLLRLMYWVGVERCTRTWGLARSECKSPIEEIMLAHIIFASFGYGDGDGVAVWERVKEYPHDEYTAGVFFDMQQPVGPYRADFLFTCMARGYRRRVVVECDGHAFHERTKEQAQRDKARDRFMTAEGITVLRFTGSEIYRNGAACREQLEQVLTNSFESALSAAGLIEGQKDRP